MANLYILPHPFFALFLLLASFLFLAEAVLCYYRWPRRHVQPREQILSEGCSLLLLFVYISLLFDVWNDQVWGLLYVHFLENTRLAAAFFGLGISLYGLCRRQWDNVALLAASIFLLPWCDRFLPWSLLIVFLLFGGRIFFLLPPAYRAARLTVTERSIQEAVDRLDDGIFISLDRGEPVLVNQTMQRVMQDILGVYVRNGNIFWHLLMHFPRQGKIRKEEQGNALLFHLPSGQAWLLRRVYLSMPGRTGWQITASEVSEWVRVNQKIAQTRKVLKKRNAALRRLLHDVGEIQGRETTAAVKSKIHDLMGQRITMLQQLLNNQNDVTYAQIAPLVQNIFADIQADIEVAPDQRLRDLLQAYRSLGVTIEEIGRAHV